MKFYGTPKVSVALCTYRPSRFLQEQLDSIAAQTVLPDEIIVTDDSQSDEVVDFIVRALERTPIPFRLERNSETLGVARNFEKAISLCRGNLIFLSDQDDVWLPEKIEEVSNYFQSHPECLLVHSDGWVTDERLNPIESLFNSFGFNERTRQKVTSGRAFEVLLSYNFCTGATFALRKELFDIARPFPTGTILHDEWLAVCAGAAGRLCSLDRKLILYRQHGKNVVGVPSLNPVKVILKRLQEHAQYHKQAVARSDALVDAAQCVAGISSATVDTLSLAREKSAFDHFRAQLPANPVSRLDAIVHRLGDYFRFALGLQSIVADCVLGGESKSG